MMEISVGAMVVFISIVAFIFPAGVFVGRLSQRVDSLTRLQKDFTADVKAEFRELRNIILFKNGTDKKE
jgi:cell shape-determining protein MreC